MTETIICTACGTHYPVNQQPEVCIICAEERQYVPEGGQTWLKPSVLEKNYRNEIIQLNEQLYEIVISPAFAIGQRAFLIKSPGGNILWDCIPLLDKKTVEFINKEGGLKAIAFSHPHYYSNMNEWADCFNCPVYIHQHDEEWALDKGPHISFWNGLTMPLWDGIELVNIGGHFDGSCVIIISQMLKGGTMLCGDTMYLSPAKNHFAIMYSYLNRIPLPVSALKMIKKKLDALAFENVYGFYSYQNLLGNAKQVLEKSFEKYFA